MASQNLCLLIVFGLATPILFCRISVCYPLSPSSKRLRVAGSYKRKPRQQIPIGLPPTLLWIVKKKTQRPHPHSLKLVHPSLCLSGHILICFGLGACISLKGTSRPGQEIEVSSTTRYYVVLPSTKIQTPSTTRYYPVLPNTKIKIPNTTR